jgi:hypothetical protein
MTGIIEDAAWTIANALEAGISVTALDAFGAGIGGRNAGGATGTASGKTGHNTGQ